MEARSKKQSGLTKLLCYERQEILSMLFLIGIGIGLTAAIAEIALVRTYQKNRLILAAIGSHWVAVGVVMPYIELGTSIWLKGIIVGVVLTVPFIIFDMQKSKNAMIHTTVFAPIWGVIIAYGIDYLK